MVRRSITVIADEFLSPPTAGSSSPTLLERLGDTAHIARIVDRYIERVLNDPELAPRFVGIDIVPLKKSQISFLTAAFGGPDQLELGHAPVDLDDEQFGRFVLHLYESLLSFGLSDSFTEQLVLAVMTRALSGDTATDFNTLDEIAIWPGLARAQVSNEIGVPSAAKAGAWSTSRGR